MLNWGASLCVWSRSRYKTSVFDPCDSVASFLPLKEKLATDGTRIFTDSYKKNTGG